MQTNFPTVTLHFVFAFTFFKLKVYKKQEAFARRVLEIHDVEFAKESDSDSWQEFDTRVLLDLVGQAVLKTIPDVLKPSIIKDQVRNALAIDNQD